MFVLLAALVSAAAPDPAVLDTITREIAQAVSADARLNVKSELDLKAIIDLEVGRQTCGADAKDCSAELANAYSARLVIVSHLNQIDDELRIDISIYDAKDERFYPTSVHGLKVRQLLDQIPGALHTALAPLPDMPPGTVVFIARTATQAKVETTTEQPASPGPSALKITGGVVGGVGLTSTLIGAGVYGYALSEYLKSRDKELSGDEQRAHFDIAEPLEVPGLVLLIGGVVVGGVGAAIFFTAE